VNPTEERTPPHHSVANLLPTGSTPTSGNPPKNPSSGGRWRHSRQKHLLGPKRFLGSWRARRGHTQDLRDGYPGAGPSASGPGHVLLTTHHYVDVGEVTDCCTERDWGRGVGHMEAGSFPSKGGRVLPGLPRGGLPAPGMPTRSASSHVAPPPPRLSLKGHEEGTSVLKVQHYVAVTTPPRSGFRCNRNSSA